MLSIPQVMLIVHEELESQISQASTRDEALQRAIAAAEAYMKAFKLSSRESERVRLKGQCSKVLAIAEKIKQQNSWTVTSNGKKEKGPSPKILKAPVSQRKLTTREEVIILESSKLHGFIFPPWTSDPQADSFCKEGKGEAQFMYVVYQDCSSEESLP
jgi:calpain-7